MGSVPGKVHMAVDFFARHIKEIMAGLDLGKVEAASEHTYKVQMACGTLASYGRKESVRKHLAETNFRQFRIKSSNLISNHIPKPTWTII